MTEFKINFLDHVAIRAKDIEVSAEWYEKVLGLKRYQVKEWGPFPLFLLAGKTGVAIFPSNYPELGNKSDSGDVRIEHFAFNVDRKNFDLARKRYEKLGIEYRFADHTHFHSLYTFDPDGHEVELTTIITPEDDFYK